MSRSWALLTIAAFALSSPLNARTLLASDEADESLATAVEPGAAARPECVKESAQVAVPADATGGMPDTGAAAAGAQVKACCWVYWQSRWWCMQC